MKIAIIYATTEGQTRRICRFCADKLVDDGHAVELLAAADGDDLNLGRFDAAILAASVHVGAYQAGMRAFVENHAAALAGRRTLFLSVSLAAAGDDPDELAELDAIADRFFRDTGWRPDRVAQVAGAFRFTQYDFFRSWAMRWIASRKGEEVDPHADKEYTDWDALHAVLHDWSAGSDGEAPG
ncbi:MAG: flavodoxin domain-containing protein [Roseovarius sp.]|nr:flavodoxin domain-containing protein [Roseovarius sp.]